MLEYKLKEYFNDASRISQRTAGWILEYNNFPALQERIAAWYKAHPSTLLEHNMRRTHNPEGDIWILHNRKMAAVMNEINRGNIAAVTDRLYKRAYDTNLCLNLDMTPDDEMNVGRQAFWHDLREAVATDMKSSHKYVLHFGATGPSDEGLYIFGAYIRLLNMIDKIVDGADIDTAFSQSYGEKDPREWYPPSPNSTSLPDSTRQHKDTWRNHKIMLTQNSMSLLATVMNHSGEPEEINRYTESLIDLVREFDRSRLAYAMQPETKTFSEKIFATLEKTAALMGKNIEELRQNPYLRNIPPQRPQHYP